MENHTAEEIITKFLHEIKAPSNAIFAQIDNVADVLDFARLDRKSGKEISEAMGDIYTWRGYFRKLTEHFTFFTKLLGDEEEVKKKVVEKSRLVWLNDRLDEIKKVLEVSAKKREIQTDYGPKRPGIPWDIPLRITKSQEVALDVILFNLLTNAYRYANYGSTCHVILDLLLPEGLLEFRPESAEGLLISVENKGIGVPEDEKEDIFDKAQRGSNTSSTGTGYGLWIARKAAELLGGHLILESWEKEKTTFCLELPARFVSWRECKKARGD